MLDFLYNPAYMIKDKYLKIVLPRNIVRLKSWQATYKLGINRADDIITPEAGRESAFQECLYNNGYES